ncbi:MAG: hypothetical protein ABW184_09695 [Sphingobium sp.]
MKGYDAAFDADRLLVICRVLPDFGDDHLAALILDLDAAVTAARRHGPLRALWDNRVGRILSPETAEAVRLAFTGPEGRGDRVAVIVPDSMAKARSRATITANTELFASEHAALTWLSVGRHSVADPQSVSPA